MRWFLQVLGFEVTVLGRVGHDVILATPLPKLLPPPPLPRPARLRVNDELGVQLAAADGVLWQALTGYAWKHPVGGKS